MAAGSCGRADSHDNRTLQSTPESGHRVGYDGYKRRKGSKVHAAVDTLGELLALRITAADAHQDRTQVADLAEAVQATTGDHVEVAFVDQGYTGMSAAEAAAAHGIELAVIKLPEAKNGFVLLPGAGWSSATSRGRAGSAAWFGTTNACPKRWPACISWRSPA